MTPIKEIWVFGTSVLFLDYAGKTNQIAECYTVENAMLIGQLLCSHHRKPLFIFDPSQRSLIQQVVGE